MDAETFKVGDVVQLKSGGPRMTVHEVLSGGVRCKWFAGSKLEEGYFEVEALIKPKATRGKESK